ncbi:hypothetical protein G7Z99_09785 [Pseudomonas entomophila]|uniref:hypothetical protein n=1 Tax=Pseudomonas entomophila TaxID=312306 RepID=UPI0015E44768|nr:hypothetical protein [Pseudomonas entomophila]MBA1189337.1 hypothetical protein [Pseudomonas entomophila]
MATKEIRISLEEIDGDTSPEVLIESYAGKELEFSISVSSSRKDGTYDKVNGSGDANADGEIDEKDKDAYCNFAQAAYDLLK